MAKLGKIKRPLDKESLQRRKYGLDPRRLEAARRMVRYSFHEVRGDIGIVFSVVKKVLGRNLKGRKIFELGCRDYEGGGHATLLEHFAKQGALSFGCDIGWISIPPELKEKMRFHQGKIQDLQKIFPDEKFDAIVSSNLLQDDALRDVMLQMYGEIEPNRDLLEDTWRTKGPLLLEIKNKLKPGGYFIIQTGHREPWYSNKELENAGFEVLAYEKTDPVYQDILLIARKK